MSGRRFAILIASSRFPNEPGLPPLQFPENDADGLSEVLRSEERGHFDDVVVLKNEHSQEVIHQIDRFLAEARKDDLVLIYYSGHGKLDRGHLYLSTTNTQIRYLRSTSIPIETIKNLTESSLSNKKVIFLDCCYSGAAGGTFTGSKGGVDDQLRMMSEGYGTYLMTASTSVQVAEERPEDQYGVFTKHIIGGIRSGEADRNNDGFITMDELYQHVHEQVRAEGCRQEPMTWGLDVKGKLVIAKSGKKLNHYAKLLEIGKRLPPYVLLEAIKIYDSGLLGENTDHIALLEKLADNRLNIDEFTPEWYKFLNKKSNMPEPTGVEIKLEIAAIRQILAEPQSHAHKKIDNALEEAEDELRKYKPDKYDVGKALERAMNYAQREDNFNTKIETLKPHMLSVSAWLGENWYHLTKIIGQ